MSKKRSYDVRESIARIFNWSFERCLYTGLKCENPPIRAHSIQNAAHLGLIEKNGHVVQLTRRLDKSGPTLRFGEVGRNKATTFLGLCAEHDNALFAPVEDQLIDPSKPEHLFLLAYRAVYRALYTEMDTASKVQTSYMERVDHGIEPRNELSPTGRYATELLIQAYETFRYKELVDEAYHSKYWGSISHDVRTLTCQAPSLAVSGFFSPEFSLDGPAYATMSVFPANRRETVIVPSYLRRDARSCRRHFRSLLRASGARLGYEVSRVVLNSCENFAIAPAVFNVWPEAKRNAILNFFRRTLFVNDWKVENPDLNLLLAA